MIRKCPKCGSRDYKRCITTDLEITHQSGKVYRRIIHDGVYRWIFECLKCGYNDEGEGK